MMRKAVSPQAHRLYISDGLLRRLAGRELFGQVPLRFRKWSYKERTADNTPIEPWSSTWYLTWAYLPERPKATGTGRHHRPRGLSFAGHRFGR